MALSELFGVRTAWHGSGDASPAAHAAELEYLLPWGDAVDALVSTRVVEIGAVRWTVHLGDFREMIHAAPAPPPHAIFYDPYSPAANPGKGNGHGKKG